MGMFDYVNFEMPCPKCGHVLTNWQSKDGDCILEKVDPIAVVRFYEMCPKCGHWSEFTRGLAALNVARATPYTREEVEALGFVLVEPDA